MISDLTFSDIPPYSLSIVPFFHVELPLIAPGINQSYMPVATDEGKARLIHTPIAKQFLEQAVWHFRDQANVKKFDVRIFDAISKTHEKVPLEVVIRFHFKSLWQKDIDGPDKIVIDSLFNHFHFLADANLQQNWNDNRVTALHVFKDITTTGHSSIEIEVRCAVSGITGK